LIFLLLCLRLRLCLLVLGCRCVSSWKHRQCLLSLNEPVYQ
jgi:hypothetical protein